MFESMYTGDYEIPDAKDSDKMNGRLKIHRPGPIDNRVGSQYTYDFPHTCSPGTECPVCPHHKCCNVNGEVCTYHYSFFCIHCADLGQCQGTEQVLFTYANVYTTAMKYGVRGLDELVLSRFRRDCDIFW